VADNDMAHLFASMGVRSGLHFERLMALRTHVAQGFDGEPLHGSIWRGGLPRTMRA
jgi:hydroxymethylglutaryl-CoA lyase